MNHFQRLSRTGRNLHSHIHEAPMTKKHFQVTGYGMVSTFIAVTSSDCVICSTLRCRLSSEWLGWRQRPLAGGGVQRTKRRPCEGSAEQSSLPAQGHGLHTFLLWKDSPKVVTTLCHFLLDDLLTWNSKGSGFMSGQGLGTGGGDLQSLPEGDSKLPVEHWRSYQSQMYDQLSRRL